jgi:hypothetical protein
MNSNADQLKEIESSIFYNILQKMSGWKQYEQMKLEEINISWLKLENTCENSGSYGCEYEV